MKLSGTQFKRYSGSHGRQQGWKAKKTSAYKLRGNKQTPKPSGPYGKYKAPK
jgi:hypothetical protein